jgi:hypothetical protein
LTWRNDAWCALAPEETMPIRARLALAAALLGASPALGDEARPADKAPVIALRVGEFVRVCETKKVICPAIAPICDDSSIVAVRDQGKGLEIVGLKPGRTLCSVMSANQARQVFAVAVER